MTQLWIAIDRPEMHLHRVSTVYVPFKGSMEAAKAHIDSHEFESFLINTLGSNPRIVTEKI